MVMSIAALVVAVSSLAGRPIDVTVYEGAGSWGGGAWPTLPYISIGRDAMTDAQAGGGHGLTVLLHELAHTTGITNEGEANCYALRNLPGFWMREWGSEYDAWARNPMLDASYEAGVASTLQQSSVYHCPTL